jgi:hypothetical protein
VKQVLKEGMVFKEKLEKEEPVVNKVQLVLMDVKDFKVSRVKKVKLVRVELEA